MTAAAPLRIAVLDDHPATRHGLSEIADTWPHGQVVLRACDGVDYEEQLATAGPIDLAIVDLRMPRRDGFETMAWIRVKQPEVRMLAITFFATPEDVHHALLVGAHGVASKAIEEHELHAALEALRTTGHYANALMLQQLTHTPDPNSPLALRKKALESISPQELVFGRHYTGDDQPSIAKTSNRMKVDEETAETFRKCLADKTGARTRTALVKWFIRNGVIEP